MSTDLLPAACPHTDFTIETQSLRDGFDSAYAACQCGLRGKAFKYEAGYTFARVTAEEDALKWWEANLIDPATPAPESPAPARDKTLMGRLLYLLDRILVAKTEEQTKIIHEIRVDRDIYEALKRWREQGSEVGTGSETSPDAGASRDALEAIANLCMAAHLVKRDAHKDAAAFSTIFTLAQDALEAKPAEASDAEQSSPRLSVPEIFEAYAGICPTCDHDFTNPPHPVAEAEQSSQPAGPTVTDISDLVYAQTDSDRNEADMVAAMIYNLFRPAQAPTRNAREAQP